MRAQDRFSAATRAAEERWHDLKNAHKIMERAAEEDPVGTMRQLLDFLRKERWLRRRYLRSRYGIGFRYVVGPGDALAGRRVVVETLNGGDVRVLLPKEGVPPPEKVGKWILVAPERLPPTRFGWLDVLEAAGRSSRTCPLSYTPFRKTYLPERSGGGSVNPGHRARARRRSMTTGVPSGSELHQYNLNLHPNEASGLLAIENEALLGEHGWDLAFWVVMDEGTVQDCVALVGHRRDAGDLGVGWEIERLHAVPVGDTKQTEDCEALTRFGGYVYVVGSHFGSKRGPLEPKRGFIARFREADVLHATEDPAAEINVSRPSFVMHRLINDAFKEHAVELLPLDPSLREAFIDETVKLGKKKKKRWAGLVREGDYPMNVEGATFRPGGNMLVGLRFPTASDGKPILVEVSGIDRLFEPGSATPRVEGFWTLDAVGRGGEIAGVRDLTFVNDELHVQTGDLDSAGKSSLLLESYPGGRGTVSTHWRVKMPEGQHSGHLDAEPVREFPEHARVEGIAATGDGRFFYVVDEDEGVHLRITRFLEGRG